MSNPKPLDMTLLPPPPDACQQCGVKHQANEPHNQESLFWQIHFNRIHGRWPSWQDAAAHCDPEVQQIVKETVEAAGQKWVEDLDEVERGLG